MPVLGVLHQALLACIAERVIVRISFTVQINQEQISGEGINSTPLSGQIIIMLHAQSENVGTTQNTTFP